MIMSTQLWQDEKVSVSAAWSHYLCLALDAMV